MLLMFITNTMSTTKRKSSEEIARIEQVNKEKRARLYDKYGYLIGASIAHIPRKHLTEHTRKLRCFYRKLVKGEVIRCEHEAAKGSLYCNELHNGNSASSLITKEQNYESIINYKGSYKNKLAIVFDAFLKDGSITDHKRELATLRTVLSNYIETVTESPNADDVYEKVNYIQSICNREDYDILRKWRMIKKYVEKEKSINDPQVIDRINSLVDNIGKSIERIVKVEQSSDFGLSPEGYKLLLRAIIEVITANVPDPQILKNVKEEFMKISVVTGGKISAINSQQTVNISSKEVQ